jgi:predicted transcriptional regulator
MCRVQPNLIRTLGKLEGIGFVRFTSVNRRKIPMAAVLSLKINIDPFSQNDRLVLG